MGKSALFTGTIESIQLKICNTEPENMLFLKLKTNHVSDNNLISRKKNYLHCGLQWTVIYIKWQMKMMPSDTKPSDQAIRWQQMMPPDIKPSDAWMTTQKQIWGLCFVLIDVFVLDSLSEKWQRHPQIKKIPIFGECKTAFRNYFSTRTASVSGKTQGQMSLGPWSTFHCIIFE